LVLDPEHLVLLEMEVVREVLHLAAVVLVQVVVFWVQELAQQLLRFPLLSMQGTLLY
jgi:hypothetical protein